VDVDVRPSRPTAAPVTARPPPRRIGWWRYFIHDKTSFGILHWMSFLGPVILALGGWALWDSWPRVSMLGSLSASGTRFPYYDKNTHQQRTNYGTRITFTADGTSQSIDGPVRSSPPSGVEPIYFFVDPKNPTNHSYSVSTTQGVMWFLFGLAATVGGWYGLIQDKRRREQEEV